MWVYNGNTTKPGNTLWNEYIEVDSDGNPTGRSSMSEITPRKITNFDACDHYYEYVEGGDSVICKHCEHGQKIIIGIQKLKDGKIVKLV